MDGMNKLWEIEFWPGIKFQIEAETEEDALRKFCNSLDENPWPGGCESTVHGTHFQVWIRPCQTQCQHYRTVDGAYCCDCGKEL